MHNCFINGFINYKLFYYISRLVCALLLVNLAVLYCTAR